MASAARPGPYGAASAAPKSSLQYRRRSLWISALYLPLLIIPWVITCVMMFRPVRKSSYGEHVGRNEFSDEDAEEIGHWLMAAKVMGTIATVIGLPVVSALLAQAAVRYSQRRREGQSLNLAQLFAIANRGWADFPLLWRTLIADARWTSPLLLYGALLVLITIIQSPIQSLLVRYETTSIATCQDVPSNSNNGRDVGPLDLSCRQYPSVRRQASRFNDPEPGDLEQCPQGLVIPKVIDKLNNIRDLDVQARLWPEAAPGSGSLPVQGYIPDYTTFLYWSFMKGDQSWPIYASALPSGTTTGVLRYHAMRQHSTARCDNVPQSSFPSACAGVRPFTTTLSSNGMVVRVCVPGDAGKAPWTRTRNRQDIDEEFWIDLSMNKTNGRIAGTDFTTHCKSTSTRGYFELGNVHNNNVPGPLLEKWPSHEELVADFNDGTGDQVQHENVPAEMASQRPDDGVGSVLWTAPTLDWNFLESSTWSPTPGPLMTTALALFGNSSIIFTAMNATTTNATDVLKGICRSGAVPFGIFFDIVDPFPSACSMINRLDDADEERIVGVSLRSLVATFVQDYFWNTNTTRTVLEVSMFAANEILLKTTADAGLVLLSRSIYSSNGYQVFKPVKSIAAIAVVSALLFLQVAAIVGLVIYNSSLPTWTSTLDGLAMAKIGKELKDSEVLSPLGVRDTSMKKLAEVDGVVGLVENIELVTETGSQTTLTAPATTDLGILGLGAPGVITRAALKKRTTEGHTAV